MGRHLVRRGDTVLPLAQTAVAIAQWFKTRTFEPFSLDRGGDKLPGQG